MGANKFIDDLSLKFKDDMPPKIKFFDDPPKTKFQDDPKIKFHDDPKIKFKDDKLKFADDPKLKVFDDPIGTYKAIDDVKHGAYDKMFSDRKLAGSDVPTDPGIYYDPAYGDAYGQTAQPFVLSTPHHSMEWAKSSGYGMADPNDPKIIAAQYEGYVKHLEQSREMMQAQMKQLDEHIQKTKKEYDEFNEQQKKGGKK